MEHTIHNHLYPLANLGSVCSYYPVLINTLLVTVCRPWYTLDVNTQYIPSSTLSVQIQSAGYLTLTFLDSCLPCHALHYTQVQISPLCTVHYVFEEIISIGANCNKQIVGVNVIRLNNKFLIKTNGFVFN